MTYAKPELVPNPRFFPRYVVPVPKVKEKLKKKMYLLRQHLDLGGEKNVCVEVMPLQMNKEDIKTVQIIPIRNSIDAVVGRGNKGLDGIERFFQMISNRFDNTYFLTIGQTSYLIFPNPRNEK